MGFVINEYGERRFVGFHYDDCHRAKADRREERRIPDRWHDLGTIAKVAAWLDSHRPISDDLRMCKPCKDRHGSSAIGQIASLKYGST